MEKRNDEITIQKLLKIFVPKLWIIAIVSVLFAVIAGTVSALQSDTYTSQGKYMMNKVNTDSSSDEKIGLNASEVEAMGIMINSMQEMIDTDNFSLKVMAKLEENGVATEYLSVSDLRNIMSITKIGNDTTCYYFAVTSEDPALSFAVAEVAGELLIEEYQKIHNYAIIITRIGDPVLPTAPNSKNIARNAIVAFVAGMLISMLGIFVISKFDVVIRSKEIIEENIDLPILGTIPRLDSEE